MSEKKTFIPACHHSSVLAFGKKGAKRRWLGFYLDPFWSKVKLGLRSSSSGLQKARARRAATINDGAIVCIEC